MCIRDRLDRSAASAAGVWFARERRIQNLVFILLSLGVIAFTLIGLLCRGPYWHFYWPWQAWPEIPTRI